MKVLAMTKDGKLTYCEALPERRGIGKCNHIIHKNDDETDEEFIGRCFEQQKKMLKPLVYHFSENEITMDDNSFILGGSQPKTVTKENKYIKFDKEERDSSGRIVMKYSYPSIAEAISSCLIRHSNINTRIRCTDYRLCIFSDGNGVKTASISDSYLLEREKEFLLASNYSKTDNTFMSGDDYREDILSGLRPVDKIVDVLCRNAKMPRSQAIQQVTDKCAVDVLLRNNDVSNNPMNFVVAVNDSQPISNIVSMDYGRCLSDTKSNTYQLYFNNFEPFDVDVDSFKEEAKKIQKEASSVSKELGIYTECVIDNCLDSLMENKNLWRSKKL